MKIITENKYKRMGLEVPNEEIEKIRNEIYEKYNYESSAYYSTSRLWDDGIIDPRDTREILGFLLSVCLNKPIEDYSEKSWPVFRM
jgi:acetyl-CoA carboxylase carboxyltransferase component